MKRKLDILFIALFTLVLAAVPAVTLLRDAGDVSILENRTLAPLPQLTAENVLSGDYFGGMESYLTDRAAGRNTLVKTDILLRMELLRQPVVNSTVVTEDLLLPFQSYGRWDTSYLAEQCAAAAAGMADVQTLLDQWGGRFFAVGLPEQYSYFGARYPGYLENRNWFLSELHSAYAGALAEAGICYLDMSEVFASQGQPVEYYFTSDHHYTLYGALATAEALTETINAKLGLSLTVPQEESFLIRELPNPFLGSRNRELGYLWESSEKLAVAEPKTPVPFTREDNGAPAAASVYALPGTDTENIAYTVYMGGDMAETIIRTGRPELPDALIVGASFTNALECVIYTAFDEMRSLDFRYYTEKSLQEYIEEYRPDIVIYVCDDTSYLSGTDNENWQ